jgi:hypothetical protein
MVGASFTNILRCSYTDSCGVGCVTNRCGKLDLDRLGYSGGEGEAGGTAANSKRNRGLRTSVFPDVHIDLVLLLGVVIDCQKVTGDGDMRGAVTESRPPIHERFETGEFETVGGPSAQIEPGRFVEKVQSDGT